MRFILFLMGFFFLLDQISAESVSPFVPRGIYVFSGEVQPVGAVQNEKVNVITAAGRERLTELKTQGFRCRQASSQFYHCRRPVKLTDLPAKVEELVQNQNREAQLIFPEQSSEPHLQTDGTAYEDWSVSDVVDFAGQSYPGYKIRHVHEKFQIVLGDGSESATLTFNVVGGRLHRYHEEVLNEGNTWVQLMVSAVYIER